MMANKVFANQKWLNLIMRRIHTNYSMDNLYKLEAFLIRISIFEEYLCSTRDIYVFNFPRIYLTVWVDVLQLFDPLHTYLKYGFEVSVKGTVKGSNICEWKQICLILLCLQTRQSLFWT